MYPRTSQPPAAEMAHVLLTDIVGYSRHATTKQAGLLRQLQAAVQSTQDFMRAKARDQLIAFPTDFGMALVFFSDPVAPVRCAFDLGRIIRPNADLELRMGLHSGLVYREEDVKSSSSVSGAGLTVAQRVMDYGDSGHILLSSAIADVLVRVGTWSEYLHDLGEESEWQQPKFHLYNFYSHDFGNPAVPHKVQKKSPEGEQRRAGWDAPDVTATQKNNTHHDAQRPETAGSLVGQLVTHYRVIREIGAGGMGVVYEAEDVRLNNRKVALKTLPDEHAHSPAESDRLKKEALAASSFSHENICTVLDVGDFHGRYFIVMELLEGENLRQLLTREPVPWEKIVELGIQIADALAYAHRRGIIHRDIKSANIFLNERGHVKVLDFGLAQLISNSTTITKRLTEAAESNDRSVRVPAVRLEGTLSYMSPEQVRGQELDARTDLFSLGVVLYEMCTRMLPFPGQTVASVVEAILNRVPTPITQLNRDLPKELENIVSKALAKDRQQRYASATELSLDLRKAQKPRGAARTVINDADTTHFGEVVLLYKRNAQPDERLLRLLEERLRGAGYPIFVDRHLTVGMEWAREIESRVKNAHAVVILLSESSVHSEMLGYEIQIAHDAAQKRNGRPRLLPIRLNFHARLPDTLSGVLDGIQYAEWSNPKDDEALIAEILSSLKNPGQLESRPIPLEAVGGAIPLDSKFYIRRPTDDEFYSAVNRNDSIILVKGARQMGKTSLMARGLQRARESGAKVVLTDLQKLNAFHLESVDKLFMTLSQAFADQLDLDVTPEETWNPSRGPSMNFERFLRREVLGKLPGRVVWGIDEADRLFSYSFASEVFGLFRSWHNERSLSPEGPWRKLTLSICYATEAHMFITDMNQSPFNVGTRLVLADFTREDVEELNKRYGSPLKKPTELRLFYDLIAGQPYLTRRGLHELATAKLEFHSFVEEAGRDDGPFGDHLRRILMSIAQDPKLCEVVRNLLAGKPSALSESFYRLRSSGIVSGDSVRDMKPRCRLYQVYLTRHLL